MKKILLVKFRTTGKVHQFSYPKTKEDFEVGEKILVETNQGIEIGTILAIKTGKPEEEPEGKIIRKFSGEDEEKLKKIRPKIKEAIDFCQEQVDHLRLPMRVLDAEFSLDEKKLTFYFIAEDRVDFRDLLSLLINRFHKNIRLQQIGPRDTARLLGGFGCCGRPLCCQSFLRDMESVSVDLAKEQDIASVGSSKITGLCGKLMCCLQYEVDVYKKMRVNLPKIGRRVKTEKGMGKVIGQNVLKQSVLVELKDGSKIEHRITKGKKDDL